MSVKRTLSIAVLSAFLPAVALAGQCDFAVKQLNKNLPFGMENAKVVKAEKINDGLCSVIVGVKTPLGERYVPTYVTPKNGVIIGGAYFLNKKNVTVNEINSLQEKDFKSAFEKHKSELKDVVFAKYKPKNANGKILYVFVDPLCPFCKAELPHLKSLADESGYTVELIPFIVHGEPAMKKMESFICSGGSFDDYVKGKFGNAKPCKKSTDLLTKALKLDAKLHLQGTPTFVTSDGKMVTGLNIPLLRKDLGIKK